MRADQSMAKVLAGMQSMADADGLVRGMSQDAIGRLVGIPGRAIGYALEQLIKAGAVSRVVEGKGRQKAMYRIGASVPPPGPVCEYEPSGIESITWRVANGNYLGFGGGQPFHEVSLARVKFLEERT